jgi:hypothetical protein
LKKHFRKILVKKFTQRCSKSLFIWEIKIKITMRDHFHPENGRNPKARQEQVPVKMQTELPHGKYTME